MPELIANISLLFNELPLPERFAAARAAGFAAIECLFPYDMTAEAIRAALAANDLRLVLINTPAGDWEKGERGFAALPDRQEAFDRALSTALDYAAACGCRMIHVLAGRTDRQATAPCVQTFIANLRRACVLAARDGLAITIEPLNPTDMPGYFLNDFEQARAIIRTVGTDNLFLQFDAYHAAMMGLDPADTFARYRSLIGHVQIADAPGRHEPGSGETDFPALFAAIAASGYDGAISCEYSPAAATRDGLEWIARLKPVPGAD